MTITISPKNLISYLALSFGVACVITSVVNVFAVLLGSLASVTLNPPDTFWGAFLGALLVFGISQPSSRFSKKDNEELRQPLGCR